MLELESPQLLDLYWDQTLPRAAPSVYKKLYFNDILFFFESNEPLPPLHCSSCLRIDHVMIFSRSHSDQELLQKFVWPWAQHSVIKHNICLLVWQKHIFAVDAARLIFLREIPGQQRLSNGTDQVKQDCDFGEYGEPKISPKNDR